MINKKLLKQIFFYLYAVSSIHAENSDGSFIATFPSKVFAGTTVELCIQFQNLDNNDMSIFIADNEPHIFEQVDIILPAENRENTCFEIKINKDAEADRYSKSITINVTSLGTKEYSFSDTKKFSVSSAKDFNIIETDKPIYKPGQTVRVRVLSLDFMLKPVVKEFNEIYIEDPSGSRVAQWRSLISPNGLIDVEMPVSEEPNFGDWKIIVNEKDGKSERIKFKVNKYVLPKFGASIVHHEKIRIDEKEINVTVCGKYSNGKGVHGSYVLKASTKKWSYKSYKMVVENTIELQENDKGCHTFLVDLEKLKGPKERYIYYIFFDASVTESGTGLKEIKDSEVIITDQSMIIEVSEINYYRPGFPIKFEVKAKSIRNEELVNEKLTVSLANGDFVFYNETVITNENGIAFVNFDSAECELCESKEGFKEDPCTIKITARVISYDMSSNNDHISYYERLFNPQIIRYINPWISKRNSYIQIFQEENRQTRVAKCDEPTKLSIKVRKNLKENEKIHFSLQSGSQIINSGYFDISGKVSSKKQTTVNLSSKKSLPELKLVTPEESGLMSENCLNSIKLSNSSSSDNLLYFKVWYFVLDEYKCKETTIDDLDRHSYFVSEQQCESSCKLADVLYNHAGKPIGTSNADLITNYEYDFDIEFERVNKPSSELQLLVFMIDEKEIIPDRLSIKFEQCLGNSVNISLDKDVVGVKEKVSLNISTQPLALCALSAIDKSVMFMGKRNEVKMDAIYSKLDKFKNNYDYMNIYDKKSCRNMHPFLPIPVLATVPIELEKLEEVKRKIRSSYRGYDFPYYRSDIYDATKSFKDSGLVILSDLSVYSKCQKYPIRKGKYKVFMNKIEMEDDEEMMVANSMKIGKGDLPELKQTLRTFFPETWLWDIQTSNEQGLIIKAERAPDSITDWVIDAYCLSNTAGLGIAKTKVLKVFQSLFVSMSLPYSVIKGETFPIKVSMFNYDNTCVPIQLDLMNDKRFEIPSGFSRSKKACICPDEKITKEFHLEALAAKINKGLRVAAKLTSIDEPELCEAENKAIDRVIRFQDVESKHIIVENEGIPKEKSESLFVVFKTEQSLTNQSLEMTLPDNLVPGSTRAYLMSTGDAMGSILNNLDKLVRQPTGCGEQNMVKFAPIISVVNYLKSTDQMTKKMNDKTIKFLKIGYQRQLTYKHKDNSYSAFGPSSYRNESGGTWLTSFVLRCLADAYISEQITIDESDLKYSFYLLMSRQDDDGSFRQEGAPLFSSALAGGLKKDKKTALSAYVLISLIKTSNSMQDLLDKHDVQLGQALEYLTNSISDIENVDTYTLALILYAFKIADSSDENTIVLINTELEKRAIHSNGMTHWAETTEETSDSSKSADLEITAYILLSKLYKLPRTEHINSIVSVAKWISSQRNSLGGFYSTQDTVVALDALSKFARKFYMKNISLKAHYIINDATSKLGSISINNENRLLAKKTKLKNFSEDSTNKISFDVSGYGTALLQMVVKYNVFEDTAKKVKDDFEFGLFTEKSDYGPISDFSSLLINAKYTGDKVKSSMALVNIKLPSGWASIEESVEKLKESVGVKLFEINENVIVLYFDEITKEGIAFKVDVEKKFHIENSKPGLISVYDYYESFDESKTHPFGINE